MIETYKKGFTLIEVLVALLVLGIAMAAIIKATDDEARNLDRLKNYTIAHWVGTDIITNIQIGTVATPKKDTPTEGTTKFKMFNKNWYFNATISDTNQKTTKQLTVTVKPNEGGPTLVTEYGFIQQKKQRLHSN